METISFKKIMELFSDIREMKVINGTDDMVIVVSGDEGAGKTIFSLALSKMDGDFTGRQIYYMWQEYVKAQLLCLKKQIGEIPPQLIEEYNVYGLTDEDLAVNEKVDLKPGSVLLYDEAGTQMHSRSSMTKANVDQVKLFISNRFLRFIHILNVPKPSSLDKYVRQERIKYFVWVDRKYTHGMTRQVRTAYFWSKNSYVNIFNNRHWYTIFNNIGRLINQCPPEYKVVLPDLIKCWGGKEYIKPDLLEEYMTKKKLFNLEQMLEMTKDKKKKSKPVSVGGSSFDDKIPLPGETVDSYCQRRKCSPRTWERYKRLSPHPLMSTTQ